MTPILFNAPMVRAILEGRKTQTRRAFPKNYAQYEIDAPRGPEDYEAGYPFICDGDDCFSAVEYCPFGRRGSRLWVREAFGVAESRFAPRGCTLRYRADGATGDVVGESGLKYVGKDMSFRWRPSIHMPRWASRLTLEITDVRVQRVQDISEEDAQAEGCEAHSGCNGCGACMGTDCDESAVDGFRDLWDSIAKPGTLWRDNPWVWAISFQMVGA